MLMSEKTGVEVVHKNSLLSDLGKTQAFLTGLSIGKEILGESDARRFKDSEVDELMGANVTPGKVIILSSPYLRCIQTSFQILLGLKVAGVNTFDNTIYTNDFLKEYQSNRNQMSKKEMQDELTNINLPEFVKVKKGGDQLLIDITRENQAMSFARTRVFLDKLSQPTFEVNKIVPDIVICVTHSFFFINLCFLKGKLMEAYGLIDFCTYSRISIDHQSQSHLDIVNRHDHLDKLNFFQSL